MSLAEGVQCTIAYKAYSTGVMQSNSQPVSATDPGPTGAQFLRRVSSSLKLARDNYKSNEIRPDRQIGDFRLGTKRVTGSISGEFSPATYFPLFEAALRATGVAGSSTTEAVLISMAASASAKTFTAGGGDPYAAGFRVGDIIQFTGMSTPANNATNFLITSFGPPTNQMIGVLPAPTDQAADTAFTMATTGKTVFMPSSGFVSRKFAFEHQFTDIDTSHLFTECRIGGAMIKLPASGLATVEFPVMGRDMELYEAGTAPFFTTPGPVTTTGIFAAVNGLLRVGGAVVGVVTGLDINLNLTPASEAVVGQNFVPEVFLAQADVTGQVTAMLESNTLITDFKTEAEIDILAMLTTTSAPNSPTVSIYLPRIKFTDAAVAVQGGAAQMLTLPFQATKALTAAAGVEATTIRITDSAAT